MGKVFSKCFRRSDYNRTQEKNIVDLLSNREIYPIVLLYFIMKSKATAEDIMIMANMICGYYYDQVWLITALKIFFKAGTGNEIDERIGSEPSEDGCAKVYCSILTSDRTDRDKTVIISKFSNIFYDWIDFNRVIEIATKKMSPAELDRILFSTLGLEESFDFLPTNEEFQSFVWLFGEKGLTDLI